MGGVSGDEEEETAATERPSFWRGALVFATYSMYIWGVSSLPPCYPAMQADLGIRYLFLLDTIGDGVARNMQLKLEAFLWLSPTQPITF